MNPEDCANVISFGISILFLAVALSMLIDEVKEYLIDRLRRKHSKELSDGKQI